MCIGSLLLLSSASSLLSDSFGILLRLHSSLSLSHSLSLDIGMVIEELSHESKGWLDESKHIFLNRNPRELCMYKSRVIKLNVCLVLPTKF